MSHDLQVAAVPARTSTPLWWLLAILVAGVFFFVGHSFSAALSEEYAPWSESDEVVASGSNPVKGAALALIGVAGLALLLSAKGPAPKWSSWAALFVLLYVGWAGASVTWSSDPAMTVRRLAVLAFAMLGALGIARRLDAEAIVKLAVATTAALAAVGIATEIGLGVFRPWGAEYRFAGTVHPNTQATQLAVLVVGSLLLAARPAARHRLGWVALATVAVGFLLLTRSRTATAALCAAIIVLLVSRSPRAWRSPLILGAASAACLAAVVVMSVGPELRDDLADVLLLGRREEAEALTGRLPIWTELWEYVMARPWTGYGYESFWTVARIEDLSEVLFWRFREAHSAYLDLLLSVGAIGASLLLSAALAVLVRAGGQFRRFRDLAAGQTLALIAFAAVSGLLESGMGTVNHLTFLLACSAAHVVFFPADAAGREE